MPGSTNVNQRILDKIKDCESEESIKKFLRKILIFEIGRKKGEAYKDRYKREIEKHLKDFERK